MSFSSFIRILSHNDVTIIQCLVFFSNGNAKGAVQLSRLHSLRSPSLTPLRGDPVGLLSQCGHRPSCPIYAVLYSPGLQ